jgi:hypothetical protein
MGASSVSIGVGCARLPWRSQTLRAAIGVGDDLFVLPAITDAYVRENPRSWKAEDVHAIRCVSGHLIRAWLACRTVQRHDFGFGFTEEVVATRVVVATIRLLGVETGGAGPLGALERQVLGMPVSLDSFKDPLTPGAYLGVLYRPDGSCINEWMVEAGYASVWSAPA